MSRAAAWHDLECGSYSADLPAWEGLAERFGGPVLDLGCGTGRVALQLARRGHEVTGVDHDSSLVEELLSRAAAEDLSVDGAVADARRLDLGREFALVVAPMQLVQLLRGREDRAALLDRISAHLSPGGGAGLAIVEEVARAESDARPLPDVLERDGWVLSSLPVALDVSPGRIRVLRLRQSVSPRGDLTEERSETELAQLSAAELGAEAARHGLFDGDTVRIGPSPDHVGSTIVTFTKAA